MTEVNRYHCRDCDDSWTTGEIAEECPICQSTDIQEVEFDEMGVAKWRLEKHENDRVAALRQWALPAVRCRDLGSTRASSGRR